jgi:hypothetical protein
LLEARVRAEEEREERERLEAKRKRIEKEQRRPFVIFIWLCIITFFIILFAKP